MTKKRREPKSAPNLLVEDWAWRFPYIPPPALVKGPSPPETRYTALLPTKARLQSRANRRMRGRVHTGTFVSHWTEKFAPKEAAGV